MNRGMIRKKIKPSRAARLVPAVKLRIAEIGDIVKSRRPGFSRTEKVLLFHTAFQHKTTAEANAIIVPPALVRQITTPECVLKPILLKTMFRDPLG